MIFMMPVRIRDFIKDVDDWFFATAAYDNDKAVGCILRYIPDKNGTRVSPDGMHYRKVDFNEAFSLIAEKKPEYAGLVHRVPKDRIKCVLKPDVELPGIANRDFRVNRLNKILNLPAGSFGVTGSMICGLENEESDIDGVVYGNAFPLAQKRLLDGIKSGQIEALDDALWHKVYRKRKPELSFEEFLIHELRKCNRGQINGTYFDLLYSRDYSSLSGSIMAKGQVTGAKTITAKVTDATFSFDSPAVYEIDDKEISRVLSFTHTYTGQAKVGEDIEVKGIIERHDDELWMIVGTSREAKGEYIKSLTLLEKET